MMKGMFVRFGCGLAAASAAGGLVISPAAVGAEAVQVGAADLARFPGGKEADSIAGDFLLHSDLVEAVVSHNAPLRRANMSTFYGDGGETPGCLYDLTPRGADNDQLTIFAPLGRRGPVSWVRVVEDGVADGEAAVETVVTAVDGGGLHQRHEYRVRDGLPGVLIRSTVRNESGEPRTLEMRDRWSGTARSNFHGGNVFGDAVDPADRAGYAFGWIAEDGAPVPPGKADLAPGASVSATRFLAVGRSPAEAFGRLAALQGETGEVRVRLVEAGAGGGPATHARLVVVLAEGKELTAYPDADGVAAFRLPVGTFAARVEDVHARVDLPPLVVTEESPHLATAEVPASAVLAFAVSADDGSPIPCKAQILGIDGTPSPDLGPPNRAHGCVDQYHSADGRFEVRVAPGTYRVVVTRGIEFDHLDRQVAAIAGETAPIEGVLRRVVDTTGWVSTDFHNHSTPSGDNTCGTDDRVINLAAEHIEFAPTTEHNRLYDWQPHIERLGLAAHVATVPGIELTGSGAHLNMFPVTPEPGKQDAGAPVWERDPRVNALHLREFQGGDPDRWVHINHPDMVENFVDRDGDGKVDGGFAFLGSMLDGLETQNFLGAAILENAPYRLRNPLEQGSRIDFIREFIWLQLLNQGVELRPIAVSDAHSVHGNGVGGWRTYVTSSTDDPARVDWREISRAAKAGRLVLTTGPILEVAAGPERALPGDRIAAPAGKIDLHVKVQANTWVAVDRIQVLVNGRQRSDLNFTRASHPDWFAEGPGTVFEQSIPVRLTGDSHLIVVATAEGADLSLAYGSSDQASLPPCAYHNPVFVDVDGDGFQPNGDTLGFPLPVKGLTPDHVRALLGATGR